MAKQGKVSNLMVRISYKEHKALKQEALDNDTAVSVIIRGLIKDHFAGETAAPGAVVTLEPAAVKEVSVKEITETEPDLSEVEATPAKQDAPQERNTTPLTIDDRNLDIPGFENIPPADDNKPDRNSLTLVKEIDDGAEIATPDTDPAMVFLSDYSGRKITTDDRNFAVFTVGEMHPKQNIENAERMNTADVKLASGKDWTAKRFGDDLRKTKKEREADQNK